MTDGLEITDLVVHRGAGAPVLDGVSMECRPGSATALLGRNGAGKSTLVQTIGGWLQPTSGSITLDGRRLDGISPERIRPAGLVAVPEGNPVLEGLTVFDNLRAAGAFHPRTVLDERVGQAFELLPELAERTNQRAGVLSGGERQMLSIAQAIVAHPRVIVIDELSLGLAPTIVKRLARAIQNLVDLGIGVLLIEQYTDIALGIADHVYVMAQGRVVHSSDSRTLLEQPDLLKSLYLT